MEPGMLFFQGLRTTTEPVRQGALVSFSESFDPRTWTRGWSPSGKEVRRHRTTNDVAGALGLSLAAAILVGGAVAAYATRSDAPALEASDG
jgi:hypothetical protein